MTDAQPNKASDQRLRAAIEAFVAAHGDPAVRRFRDAVAHWGEDWLAVAPHQLPAAEILSAALAHTRPETHDLVALFEQEKRFRKWEQSYTKADGLVGDDMLAGYGFAEVIGQRGPFVSTRVRAGIGVWGPHITYPPHRHTAEEVYLPLAGRAVFLLGSGERATRQVRGPGSAVYVPSRMTHGFRTGADPLVVFYLWQAGDLRETSQFS